MIESLAQSLKLGMNYHIFRQDTGEYLTSFYFPGSTIPYIEVMKKHHIPCVMKYLTRLESERKIA